MRIGMTLLGGIAVGAPDLGAMAVHHGAHHDRAAGRGGGVHDGLVAPEHPVVRVAAFDAYPGFVRADDACLPQLRHGVIATTCKMRLRTAEHIHQTALADRQAEQVGKRPLKSLIGQRLEGLQIRGDRMDARAKRRPLRRVRQRGRDTHPTRWTTNRQPPLALHDRRDRRQFDRIVLADRLGGQIGRQGRATAGAGVRTMIDRAIEGFARYPAMALMSRLHTAGPLCLAARPAVGRWRLRRCLRRLGRALQTQHQLDQLLAAQALKIETAPCPL